MSCASQSSIGRLLGCHGDLSELNIWVRNWLVFDSSFEVLGASYVGNESSIGTVMDAGAGAARELLSSGELSLRVHVLDLTSQFEF